MSKASTSVSVPPRPTLVDFFLLLAGCALSLFLTRWPLFQTPPPADPSSALSQFLLPLLPSLLRLPEGIILLLPLFYITQLILGRSQGLTAGEWLWLFAWLGTALLTVLAGVHHWRPLPDLLAYWPPVIWYVVLVPSMALIAVLLALVGMFSRTTPPWTQPLGLVLVIWPVLPLAGLLCLGKYT